MNYDCTPTLVSSDLSKAKSILPVNWLSSSFELKLGGGPYHILAMWKMRSIEPQSEIFPKWCNVTTSLIPRASFSRVEDIFVQFWNIFLQFQKHQILISHTELLDKMIPSDPNWRSALLIRRFSISFKNWEYVFSNFIQINRS